MNFVAYKVRMEQSRISTIGLRRCSSKGTKSTSFYTQYVWNELGLVPLACGDEIPRVLSALRYLHSAYGTKRD